MSRSHRDGRGGGAHRYRRSIGMPHIERGDLVLDNWADMDRPGIKRFAKQEANGARRRVGRMTVEKSLREMED